MGEGSRLVSMNVYPCPLCGRERNRQGRPFNDPSVTMAHVTGAHDAVHKDQRGEQYREEIESGKREADESEFSGGGGGSRFAPGGQGVSEVDDLVADLNAVTERVKDLEEARESELNDVYGELYRIGEELESRLDKQQRVIGELAEYMEIVTMAVDQERLMEAQEAWESEGSAVSAVTWEEDVYPFKQSRYE